MQYLAVSETIM